MTSPVTVAIPSASRGGNIVFADFSREGGGIWIKGVSVTEKNKQSITNITNAVERLINRPVNGLTITFHTNLFVHTMEGNSWEAMLALGIAAKLTDNVLLPRVTGSACITDSYSGSLGPVGGLSEKFTAAKEDGFTAFIIAYNQELTNGDLKAAEGLRVARAINLKDAWEIVSAVPAWRLVR